MIHLEPYSRKKLQNGWNSQLVTQLILEMNKARQPLSIRSLYLSRSADPDNFLSQVAGRKVSKKQLHNMACHYFGTWNIALESCGLSGGRIATNRFWTSTLIVKCIKALYSNGHPLTVKHIWRDRSRSTSKILAQVTYRSTTGAGLHDAARRFFDTWDRALARAGIDVDEIKEKPFWTRKKMIAAIQALHVSKVPLNAAFMQSDVSEETLKIIKSRIGKARTGKSLSGAAYRTFGSWDRALIESGLNPKDFRIRRFRWDKQSISKIVRALHKSKILLNVGKLAKNTNNETSQIILKASGRKIQGRSLYNVGRRHLGSWDNTLRYSGFIPGTIRQKCVPCESNKEQLIEFIQNLYIQGYQLSSTSVIENSKKIQKFIEVKFGQATSGYSIKSRAKKVFGSWDQALWEAGLNPNEIRRRSPAHTSHLPVVLHQLEDAKVDGERRKVKYLGAPPKSPDEILEERDAAKTLKSAIENLDEDDQDLTERIFDAILQIHHYRDQKQLIQYITRWLGGNVSEKKVAEIFSKLSKNIGRTLH